MEGTAENTVLTDEWNAGGQGAQNYAAFFAGCRQVPRRRLANRL